MSVHFPDLPCTMASKQQRPRRQTAPSGPPRKPTPNETLTSLETTQEKPPGLLKWEIPGWNNELEFSQWLNGVKEDLVEESYNEYQYVQLKLNVSAVTDRISFR